MFNTLGINQPLYYGNYVPGDQIPLPQPTITFPEGTKLQDVTRNLNNCNRAVKDMITDTNALKNSLSTLISEREKLYETCDASVSTLLTEYNFANQVLNNKQPMTIQEFKLKYKYR
jgi:hypothetical protein